MSPILLHPHAVMSLILCLTVGFIIFSFSTLKVQAPWTRWLIAACVGILGWQLDNVITFGMAPDYLESASWRKWELIFLYGLSSLFILIAQIQLAYLFPENPFEHERKTVLWISSGALVFVWLFYVYHVFSDQGHREFEEPIIIAVPALFLISWTISVYIRKIFYFRARQKREAMFVSIMLLIMELAFIGSEIDAVTIGIYSAVGYWIYFLCTWFGILGGAILYIVFSTVPITFQVRLVGFTFVIIMVVLSVVTLTFFPPFPPDDVAQRLLIQNNLLRVCGLILLSTFLVALIYPVILRASIIAPLERLLAGVNKVRQGDVTTSVKVSSMDEIGFLTENFNLMTQTIKQAQHELASYASDLEKKVEERTNQLQESLEYLKATQAQLIRREKLASMGELMAGVAHEIQNPLNFVNNFAEFSVELLEEWKAEEASPNPDKSIRDETLKSIELNLRKINEHGKRADAIVKSMLQQSRESSGQKVATDLNDLANEYLRLSYQGYRSQKEEFKATLLTQLDPSLCRVPVVVQDVSRVFQNLYNNAYYAVEMKAKTASEPYEPNILVTSRQLTDCIELRIRDNGIGIPQELQDKVFQPFFTTKPTGQGTGLGLALVYDIITNDHGGTIDLISKEGEFTEFFFTVPIS
jgi:two-component system, NtrC family, sensor kinase